jgi:hypothetical protein
MIRNPIRYDASKIRYAPSNSNLAAHTTIMPSHVKGYPIDSVNSANMLHARVTVNPVPAAPRMKIMNGIMV